MDEEDGQLQLDTIGGEDPVGLCGSGLAAIRYGNGAPAEKAE